tara:strand:- start:2506 stop:2760 length:255 start_codon:yes stop_codon:yes gene_type:complete
MSKQIKLEKNEINLLNKIKTSREMLLKEFGKISIIEIQTQNRKNIAKKEFEKLEETQTSFAKQLEDKYGKGTIDIESGIFIPLK